MKDLTQDEQYQDICSIFGHLCLLLDQPLPLVKISLFIHVVTKRRY